MKAMKKTIIPGVSLRENETLSMTPVLDDSWEFALTVYTKQLGVLRVKYIMPDVFDTRYPEQVFEYMMGMMRSKIEHEVVRRVLGVGVDASSH